MAHETDASLRPPRRKSLVRLDASDRAILRQLSTDARLSHREVAQRTGLSAATVNRRIRHLEESGVIRGYGVQLDPEAVGWGLTAVIGLRIDKGHLRTVQQEIARDDRIFLVYDITGDWDGLVVAGWRDRADLDELVKTTLSSRHIQRSNTMVVLSTVHEQPFVALPTPHAATLDDPWVRPPDRHRRAPGTIKRQL